MDELLCKVAVAVGAQASDLRIRPMAGGDTSPTFEVRDRGDGRWIVKTDTAGGHHRFSAEAEGLDALRCTRTLRVPAVHALDPDNRFLVLEAIPTRPFDRDGWISLATGLASLHRWNAGDRYGWSSGNFIGPSVQHNSWGTSWVDFWRECRLEPQVKRAVDTGRVGSSQGVLLAAILDRLEQWVPVRVQPSLLHGDLWSGNVLLTTGGQPVLIDPAVAVGDREADLAMTHMFGGFPSAFHEAYDSEYHRPAGWSERLDLYTLYHWLNHLNCFGMQYAGPVRRIARRYGS